MTRYRDIRKIDPSRGATLGDGSPNDADRVEIGADGALTSVGTAMSPNAGSFRQLIVSRSGRYLYAMANENNAQTNQFAINSDGTLTPLVPFSIPMWSVDAVASGTWR